MSPKAALGRSAVLLALATFVWLSVRVYRADADPEAFAERGGSFGWILGPTTKALNGAADRRIAAALDALNDVARSPAERLEAYRRELGRAERLLVRSLEASPAQARTLARLAAVRWEISPPADEAGRARHLEMIAVASRMAPRVPDVQAQLGELLLRMGRTADGLPYLKRAIELDARTAPRAVRFLREQLFGAAEIAAALPAIPQVLVALAGPYLEDGQGAAWLDLADPALPGGGAELIAAFGDACLRTGEGRRLEARLDRLGPLPEPRVEAERLRQRALARLENGEAGGALEDATAAAALVPDDPGLAEQSGNVALRAGKPAEAAAAFRKAIALVSRGSGDPGWRARLYASVGSAEEARGKPDLAFDAYRMAVRLDPGVEPARRRLREMGRAAGGS